jgi:hypothetical protein
VRSLLEPSRAPSVTQRTIVAVAVVAAVALMIAGCNGNDAGVEQSSRAASAPTAPAAAPSSTQSTRCTKNVTYHIEGTATGVNITSQNRQGNSEQHSAKALPLRDGDGNLLQGVNAGSFSCGDFVYLSVQNNTDSGSVSCAIKADGVEIERATSSGGYVIATCSGTVPE